MQFFKYIKSTFSLSSIIMVASIWMAHPVTAKETSSKHDFTVVIDAGHGGKDFGAVDNNTKEKEINLEVAKKLAAKIKKGCKNVNVVLTRDNDTFITLQERAKIANDNKGNLFISIHTNSVDKNNPKRKSVAGASVYALGLHKDKNNLEVAMRENSVIELEKNFEQKYSGFDPSKDESYIIFEMAQKKNLGQSLKFADLAQKNLVSVAGRGDRGVKQAGFWVLWATSMPAVLVELDFICNPNSAIYMASEKGQEQMAEALFKAFEKYYASVNSQKKVAAEEKVIETKNKEVEAMPVVASAQPVQKQSVDASAITNRASTAAKRRRRSDSARKLSDSRNVETASIPLHSEAERLPNLEKKDEQPLIAAVAPETSAPKDKKEKRKKKDVAKKENTVKATYNNKTVVINKDGSTALADSKNANSSGLKRHHSISGYHSKVEKLKTVYKIQILASAELLKQNNPEFRGLTPVKSFKENNLYKYTYGESESKQEMETLLKQVKKVIPDAFIIKSLK